MGYRVSYEQKHILTHSRLSTTMREIGINITCAFYSYLTVCYSLQTCTTTTTAAAATIITTIAISPTTTIPAAAITTNTATTGC